MRKDAAHLNDVKPAIPKFNMIMIGFFLAIFMGSLLLRAFDRISLGNFITFSTGSLGAALMFAVFAISEYLRLPPQQLQKRIREIEEKAEKQPEKVRYAWDLARIKMEAYFDRNLIQINSIFWISVVIMIVGFCFILYGVTRSMDKPEVITTSYIASIAGIITEFIGATFMLIYRSTMRQALSYMATLERINSVGMAVQILDSISDKDEKLKNETKSELVKLLLVVKGKGEK